jgi:hypothetical protein
MERYGKKRENSFEKPLKAPCFDEFTRPPWCNYSDGNCMFSASKDAQMQPQPCGITEFSTDPSCFAQCCCGSLLNMLRDGHVLGKGVAFLGSSTLEERRWLAGTWARTSPSQILQFWINIYIYGFQVGKTTFENLKMCNYDERVFVLEQHWNDSMKVTQQWQVGAGYLQRPELTAERFVCGSQLISAVACCFAVMSLRPNPFVDANQDLGVANRFKWQRNVTGISNWFLLSPRHHIWIHIINSYIIHIYLAGGFKHLLFQHYLGWSSTLMLFSGVGDADFPPGWSRGSQSMAQWALLDWSWGPKGWTFGCVGKDLTFINPYMP